jgi:hypothetical protein
VIVQSRHEGDAHLVLTMEQHTATAGQLAEHFGGTSDFERLEPNHLVVGLVHEHDRGWVEVDATALRDPDTDLPWSVYDTPTSVSIGTGPRSIDHNEKIHPYRGLLSSMHIVGLFTGRFGLDDVKRIDVADPESRALLEPMIAAERARQTRLRAELATDPVAAAWIAEPALMRNYKALQFFDKLALWLQVTHPARRRPTLLHHVPTVGDDDVTVAVTPRDELRVELEPYPFDSDPLEVTTEGRWLSPQPPGADLAQALGDAPAARQRVELSSG